MEYIGFPVTVTKYLTRTSDIGSKGVWSLTAGIAWWLVPWRLHEESEREMNVDAQPPSFSLSIQYGTLVPGMELPASRVGVLPPQLASSRKH